MADPENETQETTQSLEEIATEFNVGNQTQTEQSTPQPSPNYMPDPVTQPDEFRQFQANSMAEITRQNQQLNQRLTQFETERAQTAEKAELEGLVDKMAPNFEGVPKPYLKYALADHYEQNPIFAKIWDNRSQNPQALEKAITAITPEIQKQLAIQPNAQLEENQRALEQSTKSTTAEPNPNQDVMNLNNAEFGQEWERLKSN